LVVVSDLSDVLLDSVFYYFIKDFWINVHLGAWPIVFLFGGVFVWFWDECNTVLIKLVRQCSFPFYLVEQFMEGWY
jgi:hypothetical protein